MSKVAVIDRNGQVLSPCSAKKASILVGSGQAQIVNQDPLTIKLHSAVIKTPARAEPEQDKQVEPGQQMLLHICCGPCATFTSTHLATLGFTVTGYWYNPNIEPDEEQVLRKASLERLAGITSLPVVWDPYTSNAEFRAEVAGHERYGERCEHCYRLRLRKTAREAADRNIGFISTSLLISPYQNLESIREIGSQEAAKFGIRFYYENMRRGYPERTRLSREYGLYLQDYCGCLFSAREAQAKKQRQHTLRPTDENSPC